MFKHFSRRTYPPTIICRICGWKSVSIRNVLLPAISTPICLVFLSPQANAEIISRLRIANPCISCCPLNFNSSKFNPLLKYHQNILPYYALRHLPWNQNSVDPASSSSFEEVHPHSPRSVSYNRSTASSKKEFSKQCDLLLTQFPVFFLFLKVFQYLLTSSSSSSRYCYPSILPSITRLKGSSNARWVQSSKPSLFLCKQFSMPEYRRTSTKWNNNPVISIGLIAL